MDAILRRIESLEKQVAELKQMDQTGNVYSFKDSIESISITENDLDLVLASCMKTHIIRVITDTNKAKPFLKWKRILYKYDGEWTLLLDEDIVYMMEYIEKIFIDLYKEKSGELNPEKFFETAEIIYGFNLKKNFKKIKTELLQSL